MLKGLVVALSGVDLTVAIDTLNIEYLERVVRKALLKLNPYYRQNRLGT
jgi:hypothetical protein